VVTLAELARTINDSVNTDCIAEPFLDKLTDSLVFYAKDVDTYANRLNNRFTLFLDANDDSLVGFEIKGFSHLVRFMTEFDVFVTNSTVRLEHSVVLAMRPDDFSTARPDRDGSIESIKLLLRRSNLNERRVNTDSLSLCDAR